MTALIMIIILFVFWQLENSAKCIDFRVNFLIFFVEMKSFELLPI